MRQDTRQDILPLLTGSATSFELAKARDKASWDDRALRPQTAALLANKLPDWLKTGFGMPGGIPASRFSQLAG
jgi:hypothetical protein